jgi:hypothetical protein
MGAVAPTAFTSGKRHMQTKLAKFFSHPFMTCDTHIAIPFYEKAFFLGSMRQMAGQALSFGGRGMAKGSLAIFARLMAFRTERGGFRNEALVHCLAVSGMAIETGSVFIGFMTAAHFGSMLIRMAP